MATKATKRSARKKAQKPRIEVRELKPRGDAKAGFTCTENPLKPGALILLSIRGHKIDRYEQVMAVDAVAHNIGGNAFTEPSE